MVFNVGFGWYAVIDSKLKFLLLLFTGYFNLSDKFEMVGSSEKIR